MSFGNLISPEFKHNLAVYNIKIGAVIRILVKETIPPKVKYLVVVGLDGGSISFATIYINTEINMNVINTPELQNLQVWLESSKCQTLEHDSYADCSKIVERNILEVAAYIAKNPASELGMLEKKYLTNVLELLKTAATIIPYHKKKYGF